MQRPQGLAPPETHTPVFHCHHLLCKIGEILDDFSNKRERARCPVVRVLLHEAEEAGGHDGGAQEAKEEGGTDEAFTDVLLAPAQALLLPRCKYFLQLTREHAGKKEPGNKFARATRCNKLNW